MNNSQKVFQLGQSIWYDNIQRKLLENGELSRMISEGLIYGVTSNPSIFNNAIAKTDDYDEDLLPLLEKGKQPLEIFETLAVADIQEACDLFAGVYQSTGGQDGFVSLEVNPTLANNTEKTCDEVLRLWQLVNRPNLMIKIPATLEGIPAVERSIAEGVNVNITLIFSQKRYEKVMEAFLTGLERRVEAGKPLNHIASVASFFVSRMDTKVDNRLDAIIANGGEKASKAEKLKGKSAIANAKLAYEEFLNVFSSERFRELKSRGGNIQRPLWASTSTKNPAYPDTLYVDNLIGPNTVNTVPPRTLEAFNDHGSVATTIESDLPREREILDSLEDIGISLQNVTDELEEEGVASFSKSFESLLKAIDDRRSDI
ncbi:MAG: transaldolase [Anaerolineales bacterium]